MDGSCQQASWRPRLAPAPFDPEGIDAARAGRRRARAGGSRAGPECQAEEEGKVTEAEFEKEAPPGSQELAEVQSVEQLLAIIRKAAAG